MIEIELYGILNQSHKLEDIKRGGTPLPVSCIQADGVDEDVRVRSVIHYVPVNSWEIIDGTVQQTNYSPYRYSELVYPAENLDNYKEIGKYEDGVEFDLGGRNKNRDKHDPYYQDLKINRHLVKFLIMYEDKRAIDFKNFKINSITVERFHTKMGMHQGTQTFKIVNLKDYSKYDCFKYYTLTL